MDRPNEDEIVELLKDRKRLDKIQRLGISCFPGCEDRPFTSSVGEYQTCCYTDIREACDAAKEP